MRRMGMRIDLARLTFICGALLLAAPLSQASVAPAAQFDFLIGEHDVTLHAWTGDGWTPARPQNARWNGRRGLESSIIYDEWFDPQGGDGVNVRMYDPNEEIWKMMWISTAAYQVQDLRAQMKDGVLTMWQIYPDRTGWRAEFEILNACQWARVDFQEDEAGEAPPRYRLVATRRGCSE